MRSLRPFLTVCLAAGLAVGCVSRNVEKLSAEEAASMSAPPEPLSAEAREAAPASEPGFAAAIRVDDAVTSVPDGVVFVVVRVGGRTSGPPLAVKRLPASFPVEVNVTSADAMIPGTPLVDGMDVTVRLDQDGNAFSQQDGDLAAAATGVKIGDTVEFVLAPAEVTPTQ